MSYSLSARGLSFIKEQPSRFVTRISAASPILAPHVSESVLAKDSEWLRIAKDTAVDTRCFNASQPERRGVDVEQQQHSTS